MIHNLQLKQLVSKDLGDAFNELEKVLSSEKIQINEYIILKGRHNQIEADRRKGILTNQEYYIEQNMLRLSFLGLIDEFSDVKTEEAEKHKSFQSNIQNKEIPRLEIELIPTGKWKRPRGLSPKNKANENGAVWLRDVIYINEIGWKYELIIRNNSNYSAFYPELEFKKGKFKNLINNLNKNKAIQPFEEITLNVKHSLILEATGKDAIKYMDSTYLPDELENLTILLKYENETKDEIINKFQIVDGDGYNEIV